VTKTVEDYMCIVDVTSYDVNRCILILSISSLYRFAAASYLDGITL